MQKWKKYKKIAVKNQVETALELKDKNRDKILKNSNFFITRTNFGDDG